MPMNKAKAETQTGTEDVTPMPVVRETKHEAKHSMTTKAELFTFDHDKRRAWALSADGVSVEVDYQNACDAYRGESDDKAATAAAVARVYPVG